MAKIKFSAIGITNASGKSGGTVFSHNRGGSYIRRWAKPTNAQTSAQTALRSIFSFVTQKWGQLTEEQARGWETAAENVSKTDVFGDSRKLNGFEYFVQANQNRMHGGFETPILSPMERRALPALQSMVVSAEVASGGVVSGSLKFETAEEPVDGDFMLSIGFAVVPAGSRRSYGSVKNKFGNRLRVPITDRKEHEVDLAGHLSSLGISVGETVYVQVHVHSIDGQKSNEVTAKTVVELATAP